MADDTIPCPVCNRQFPPKLVEEHVNKCLFLNTQTTSKRDGSHLQAVSPQEKRFKSRDANANIFKEPKKRDPSTQSEAASKGINIKPTSSNVTSNQSAGFKNLDQPSTKSIPLAERMRPISLDDIVGQKESFGAGSMLRSMLEHKKVPNMILWGPPGCGKTSLANVVSAMCKEQNNNLRFVKLSATMAGIGDVKEVVKVAKNEAQFKRQTVLFMDEIHRFNKLQQDTFLPHVENGTIILIGATTENPSFSLNNALLSRCRVVVLEKLSSDDVFRILEKALAKKNAMLVDADGPTRKCEDEEDIPNCIVERASLRWLADVCDGDARVALGALELALESREPSEEELRRQGPAVLTLEDIQNGIKCLRSPDWVRLAIEKNPTDLKYTHRTYNTRFTDVCDGDARVALGALELALESREPSAEELRRQGPAVLTLEDIQNGIKRTHMLYDKGGEEHYNIVSAMHKSIRAGDDNAALYWTMRALHGGEDPLYVARRLVRASAEDIDKSIRAGDDNAALYWTTRALHGGEDPLYVARRLVRASAEDIDKSIRAGDDNAALYWTTRALHGGEDPLYVARRLVRASAEDIDKSIRAGDDNAALYWTTRALHGGEDPLYVARRLVRASAEDIGLADPNALVEAVATLQGCQQLGMPECNVLLAQCAVRLARAPKSVEVYHAMQRCQRSLAEAKGPLPSVPLHLRNAPTKLMKQLGYARGYNTRNKNESGLCYMPEGMENVDFFQGDSAM
ncbi:unnamed protein product [Plutella xylostella]|uniref:(diamondback moth) hypothetical protein n=1 Tax=Plutella xylostella TaxID=51655 RepID=A0A8S4DF30_PLUXY|nr:unnamed protein product [Plutella xylostella]